VNLRTVQRIIKLYRTTGQWGKKTGGGWPRATTPEQDSSLIHRIEQEPSLSARALRAIENLPCTPRTVNRRLHEGGKEQRRERLKGAALLNQAVRDERVEWVERVSREWARSERFSSTSASFNRAPANVGHNGSLRTQRGVSIIMSEEVAVSAWQCSVESAGTKFCPFSFSQDHSRWVTTAVQGRGE